MQRTISPTYDWRHTVLVVLVTALVVWPVLRRLDLNRIVGR